MNNSIVTITQLTKTFPVGKGEFTALRDIDFTVSAGEFTGIVGPSGSGKTTLLNIIGTLDTPTEGSANVLNEDTRNLSQRESANLRSRYLGFIFQTYNLLPVYTVFENVELPLLLLHLPASQRRTQVLQALEWVGLTDKTDSRPAQLSGGECQRVAVARAMVKKPAVVLADEPTANLDSKNSHNILNMMVKLNQELNTTFIFSTHDEKVIKYLRRVVTLEDGRIINDRVINNSEI